MKRPSLVLAFDTATDALALGFSRYEHGRGEVIRSVSIDSPRKANSSLLPLVEDELDSLGAAIDEVGAVVVGLGPGSFTGVRIGVATAKGLAQGLGMPLYGVGTLDAIAQRAVMQGAAVEGELIGVVGDAMRGEVYPALFRAEGANAVRLTPDRVAHPSVAAAQWAASVHEPLKLAGNGLRKYADTFLESLGGRAQFVPQDLWAPDGASLLAVFEERRARGVEGDGEPALVLPVYTRLSDAEETERARLGSVATTTAEDPIVAEAGLRVRVRPMTADDLAGIEALEREIFSDPWSSSMFRDELTAPRRAWIVVEDAGEIVGYGGVAAFGDDAHVMNLAVRSDRRGQGLGRLLLRTLGRLAVGMGTEFLTLEVRETNKAAISLYESEGLTVGGVRKRYYPDTGEDALIMWGPAFAGVIGPTGVRGDETKARHRDDVICGTVAPRGQRGDEDLLVLAIESSCDETAAAVVRGPDALLANVVASQVDFHARFGGVVPEIASRKHTEAIVGVIDEAMELAGTALECGAPLPLRELDGIAVTHGPGLVGALVVGLAYAKGLSFATGVPLVGVNHLEGHIFANVLADPDVKPPLVALVVSGGHTSLVHMPEWGVYKTLGETLDDAAGEAFDKVAKYLGLGYPGGPILSKLAETGDPAAIDFPRAMLRSGDFRFSLSGLKTSVINHIRHEREAGREIDVPDLAASFQAAVIDVQVAKAVKAVKETGAAAFCLAGGVAANPALREGLRGAIEPLGVHVSVPPFHLCTDNAAMIAAAAHYRYLRGERLGLDAEADPGLRLDTPDL